MREREGTGERGGCIRWRQTSRMPQGEGGVEGGREGRAGLTRTGTPCRQGPGQVRSRRGPSGCTLRLEVSVGCSAASAACCSSLRCCSLVMGWRNTRQQRRGREGVRKGKGGGGRGGGNEARDGIIGRRGEDSLRSSSRVAPIPWRQRMTGASSERAYLKGHQSSATLTPSSILTISRS